MSRTTGNTSEIPPALRGQRYPAAPWLYLPRWRHWQKNRKPVSGGDWLAFDVGMFLQDGKRAVLETAGSFETGLAAWLSIVTLAGQQGTDGLIWGAPEYLAAQPATAPYAHLGLEWLLAAGWAVCLTLEQAEAVRQGRSLSDLTVEPTDRAQEVFDAVAERLDALWGPRRSSGKSEALYWRPDGRPGRQVRLARRKRRRSADTVCDIIVSDDPDQRDAGDIAIDLDRPLNLDAIVARIQAGLGAPDPDDGGKQANSKSRSRSPQPHSGAKKGDSKRTVKRRAANRFAQNRESEALDAAFSSESQKQYRTEQYRTEPDRNPGTGDSPTGSPPARAPSGSCGGVGGTTRTGPDPTEPERTAPGRCEPENPTKSDGGRAAGPQIVPLRPAPSARRRGRPERIGAWVRPPSPWWHSPECVAFGRALVEALFEVRLPEEDGDLGREWASQVGAFAAYCWRLAPSERGAQQVRALEKVRDKRKELSRARSPAAVLTTVLQGRGPPRSKPA